MQTKHAIRTVATLVLLVAASQVHASDFVWINTAGGNWATAANWSPSQVPGATDTAWITNSGTYTVTISANVTAASLQAGGGTGTQTLALSSGTLTLNGASRLDTNCTFAFSGGTLTGSGDVTVAGTLTWSGGAMSGSGKTIIANGGTLSLNTAAHELNRVLQNGGTATWTAGPLTMDGGTFNNHGAFTANSSALLDCYGPASGVNAFNNAGTFTKLGPGLTTLRLHNTGVRFNNTGAVDVQGGTLGLDAGGTHSSDFAVASGAALRLDGAHSFSAGSDITGAGGLSVAGGTITDAGRVNLGGTGTFSGGTATFTGSAFAVGVLAITGGTANLSASTPVSFSSGTLSSGALGGSSDVTCTGLLLWSGGAMSGSGKTIIANGGTLSLNTAAHELNRVLQNGGTATWTAGPLTMDGGTFNNHGAFTANSSALLDCYGPASGVNAFNNAGTFTKLGSGLTTLRLHNTGVRFNNTGAVDVQGGTLGLDAGFSQTAGSTLLNGGNVSSSSALQIQGGTLGGVGTVTANVTSSGIVSPGASPGVLTITGDYTESTNAHLQIELGGPAPGSGHDQLSVGGTATLAGTLDLSFWNGFTPAPGNVFTALVCNARSGAFSAIQAPTSTLGVLYNPKSLSITNTGAQPSAPDFIVTSVTFSPTEPVCGQAFTAYVTVKNQGTGPGNGGWLDIWKHRTNTKNPCGVHGEAFQKVGVLAAGASKTLTISSLTAPSNGAPWTFQAAVDSACATTESNEVNNVMTVSYGACPGPPDFVVTSITFNPAIPLCGQPFTANVTVTNRGAGPGDAGWLDVWTHQPTRQECGADGNQYKAIGTLAAGASKTLTLAGLPAPTNSTPWTFRAFVDSTCMTTESNDTNNQTTVSYGSCPVGKPDFVVTTVTFSPPTPVCGQAFTAYVTVKNQGPVPGNGGWLDIWKHRTNTKNPCGVHGEAFQKVGVLAAGASKTLTISSLSAPTNGAPWTFQAAVDSACATTESNEVNNVMTVSYGACPGPPDFVVTSITFDPATPLCNRLFTANVTVTNQGTGPGDAGWLDIWTHQPADQACGANGDRYERLGTLAAGASKTLTFTRLVPPTKGAPWSLRAFVDSTCMTTESNETNNQRTVSYGFCPSEAPDFVVTTITLSPTTPVCGQPFTAYVTVKNQGLGLGYDFMGLTIWKNRPDPAVSAVGDAYQEKLDFYNPLLPGASKTFTFRSLTAPTNNAPWTFRAFVDPEGRTAESSESNNQKAVSYGACVPPPDFVVTSITFDPATPLCGQPFTANVTVKNQGAGAGDGGALDVWFNRSAMVRCNAGGNQSQSVGTLAEGASKTLTFTGLSAPITGAPWTFLAFVDSTCRTLESNDNNNQLTASYGFCGPQPDFAVSIVDISPRNVKPRETFTAYIMVQNAGIWAGNAGWLDVWANKSTPASCGDNGDACLKVPALDPGQYIIVPITGLTAGPAGPNTLRAFADSDCATGESSENNNQASLTYYPAVEVWDFLVMPEAFYNPTPEQWKDVKNQFRRASNFLYDATDGQVRLGLIQFKDPNWDYPWEAVELKDAHIQLWHVVRSMAIPGWVVLLGMVDPEDPDNMWWHCFSTIVHELGHYKFRLYDEYTDFDRMLFGGSPRTRYCKSRLRSGSIMDANFYGGGRGTSEYCTPHGSLSMHDPRDWTNDQPAYTVQDFIWGGGSHAVSAWEVIHHYNAAIRMPTGDPKPGPCSMSSDPYAELSHEPLGDNEGAAVWVNIVGP